MNQLQEQNEIKIWLQVVRAYQKTSRLLSERLRALDLSTSQLDVLANLVRHPEGMTQTALGEKLLVTKGNVSGLVERLVARGLVERRSNPADGRSKNVVLTSEGQDIAEQAVALQRKFVSELMSVLGEGEMDLMSLMMERVEAHLDQMS